MSRLTRLALAPVVLAPALALTACNSFGSHAVRTARFPYNEALARTSNEQLLLNLVRLRYRDTPYFLQETSLTTQYELSGAASAGVTIVKGGDNEGSTGGGVGISETPTVNYVPLQGEDFVKQLMSRIRLEDVMLLPESGWSIERVLRLAVDRLAGIPNAPSTTGPTPGYRPFFEDFNNLACRLRRLQVEGRLELEAVRFEPSGVVSATEDGEDGRRPRTEPSPRCSTSSSWSSTPATGARPPTCRSIAARARRRGRKSRTTSAPCSPPSPCRSRGPRRKRRPRSGRADRRATRYGSCSTATSPAWKQDTASRC